MVSRHRYKNCRIILMPDQNDKDQWSCTFIIVKLGRSEATSKKHYLEGTFETEAQAKAAALEIARRRIDEE